MFQGAATRHYVSLVSFITNIFNLPPRRDTRAIFHNLARLAPTRNRGGTCWSITFFVEYHPRQRPDNGYWGVIVRLQPTASDGHVCSASLEYCCTIKADITWRWLLFIKEPPECSGLLRIFRSLNTRAWFIFGRCQWGSIVSDLTVIEWSWHLLNVLDPNITWLGIRWEWKIQTHVRKFSMTSKFTSYYWTLFHWPTL